jgi:hypothetical protein
LLAIMHSGTAHAGVSVAGSLTHERETQPGTIYEGSITVVNSDLAVQEVEAYQTDYLFFADGTSLYDQPGTDERSNAAWIKLGPHRLAVPPGGSSTIRYTLTVPDSAGLAGTYWSLIMVEPIEKRSLEASLADDGRVQLGINQVVRYGVQIVTHIGITGQRSLAFINTDLIRDGAARTLSIDIGNTGQRLLRPTVWVELYDTEGRNVSNYDAGRMRVYPAASARFNVDLSDARPGDYKAVIVADCGGEDVFGATHSITLRDETYTVAR